MYPYWYTPRRNYTFCEQHVDTIHFVNSMWMCGNCLLHLYHVLVESTNSHAFEHGKPPCGDHGTCSSSLIFLWAVKELSICILFVHTWVCTHLLELWSCKTLCETSFSATTSNWPGGIIQTPLSCNQGFTILMGNQHSSQQWNDNLVVVKEAKQGFKSMMWTPIVAMHNIFMSIHTSCMLFWWGSAIVCKVWHGRPKCVFLDMGHLKKALTQVEWTGGCPRWIMQVMNP